MSAFICTDKHISALAVYAVEVAKIEWHMTREPHDANKSDAELIAELLHAENVRSVNTRYSSSDEPFFSFVPGLRASVLMAPAVKIIKAARCYAYQACESDSWGTSYANELIEAIVGAAEQHLPGYEHAGWGSPV